ncbi:MAG: class I SAM-dependent methyltransferase [Euryarchaeota archaeon]|nr:class I SAM-dependent methyltransferase [Euryarchaeota archaeon]
MRLHDLLNLDAAEPIFLAENSFSDLRRTPTTEEYLQEFERIGDMSSARPVQLVDNGATIAFALYLRSQGIDHWLVLTNIISKDERFAERVRAIAGNGCEVIEIDFSELRSAVIEYYSIFLANQWLCESCAREELPYLDIGTFTSVHELLHGGLEDVPGVLDGQDGRGVPDAQNERYERLLHLLRRSLPDLPDADADVLEICCGAGGATGVLHSLGCDPICIDYDKCDICDGLRSGALHESRSIVLDATELSMFFGREFDCVTGFMIGPIQPFNKDIWATILRELTLVVRTGGTLIFTFYAACELEFAAEVFGCCGVSGRGFENLPDLPDIGYDRWAYIGSV